LGRFVGPFLFPGFVGARLAREPVSAVLQVHRFIVLRGQASLQQDYMYMHFGNNQMKK
jgi:hypothetical protein